MLDLLIEVGIRGVYPKDKTSLDPYEGSMVAYLRPKSAREILDDLIQATVANKDSQAVLLSMVQVFRDQAGEPPRSGLLRFLLGQKPGFQAYIYAPTRITQARLAHGVPQSANRAGIRIIQVNGFLDQGSYFDIGVTKAGIMSYGHGQVDLAYKGMNQGNRPFYPLDMRQEPNPLVNQQNFQLLDRLILRYGPAAKPR